MENINNNKNKKCEYKQVKKKFTCNTLKYLTDNKIMFVQVFCRQQTQTDSNT